MKINKGIVLAGGTGSRLGSLSRVTNKHLLPIGHVPMIYHPISQLLLNNITDICVVSGTNHLGLVVELLGSGVKFNCEFTYKVQDGAGGIAEALSLCRGFANEGNVAVFLGDNIFGSLLDLSLLEWSYATFFLKQVSDPERFGIAEVDHRKKLIDISEKPTNLKSNMAVCGVYVYSWLVWSKLREIKRSNRGELEISDVNRLLLKSGIEGITEVHTREVVGWWADAGTQESYTQANQDVWNKLDPKLMNKINEMAI